MALEACLVVGRCSESAVGAEASVFPLAVSQRFRIFGTPTCPFLHDDDAVQATTDQAAVGISYEFALVVQQRLKRRRAEPSAASTASRGA